MSLVAIVARDLIIATRIADAASEAGYQVIRVDRPSDLPAAATVHVAFVDWGAREPSWATSLTHWMGPAMHGRNLVLFGPHTDLSAHAEARAAGLGPMLARSKLVTSLADILRTHRT